jgi:hypothetical protein
MEEVNTELTKMPTLAQNWRHVFRIITFLRTIDFANCQKFFYPVCFSTGEANWHRKSLFKGKGSSRKKVSEKIRKPKF